MRKLAAQQVAASRVLDTEAAVEEAVTGGVGAALTDRRADRAPADSAGADAVAAITAAVPLLAEPRPDERVYPPEP